MSHSYEDNIKYLFSKNIDVARIKSAGYASRLASQVRRAESSHQPVPTREKMRGFHPKQGTPRVATSRVKYSIRDNKRLLRKAGVDIKGIKSDKTLARLARGVRKAEKEGLKKTPGKTVLYGKGNATYHEFEREGHRLNQTVMIAKKAPGTPPPEQGQVPWVRTLQADDLQQLLNLAHPDKEPLYVTFVGWVTQYPGYDGPQGDIDDKRTWFKEIATVRISSTSLKQWIAEAQAGAEPHTMVDLANQFYGSSHGAVWAQIDQVSISYPKGDANA